MPWGSPSADATRRTVITRPRFPSVSRVEAALWGIALVAMVADLVATVHGLALGLRELNPVARSMLESMGVVGFVWLKVGAVGVAVACRSVIPDWVGPVVPAALALPWAVAATVNAVTILAVH